jgi:hypothetical protein
MNRTHIAIWCTTMTAALFLTLGSVATARAADPLVASPDWEPASLAAVRADVDKFLAAKPVDTATRQRAQALWADDAAVATPAARLDRLADTFALVRGDARQLVAWCEHPNNRLAVDHFAFLSDPKAPPLLRNNMRLAYGRRLAQQLRFDDALEVMGQLRPEEVVDPATLLFYQALCHHQLVQVEPSREVAAELLQREDEIPRRYREVARLLLRDSKDVKVDSLDHIARRMDDISRRLQLGQADQPVRKVEDGVVESLDKLLKKLEEQARQQQAKGASGGQLQSNNPASESRIMGGKGPGKVDKKPIGDQQGWGNLPAKERQEAIQQIGRRFPSHYREAVEQYFKRLAKEQ